MSTALSSGSPTRSFSMRARSFSISLSAIDSATSSREPAQQTWPWLNQIASTAPSTTLSMSASSNTRNGLLPPSSSESRLPLPAVARRIARPTSVEPVKATLSTPGWSTSAAPVRPSPVTMLTTPSGRRAATHSSANASAVSDVYSAGFSTSVLPAASAGAIFQASISSGKFHGMIWPTTPSGSMAGELAVAQLRPARVVVEVARDQRDVDVARLADRLAVVERLEHGEQARVLLHLARERVEVARALVAGQAAPGGEGAPRGLDRRTNLFGRRLRDPRELLAGGGIDAVEVLAPRREGAADEVAEDPPVAVEPLDRGPRRFGRRAVLHRLEDLRHLHSGSSSYTIGCR